MSPLLSDAWALAEKAFTSRPTVLFTIAIGTRTWRYAQSTRDVTVATSGLTYRAAQIQVDGDVERRDELGAQRIPVRIGIRADVVPALRANQTEPMYLGIHRYHASVGGLPRRWAFGEIASGRAIRGWYVIELQTEEAAWEREVPRAIFAPQCQKGTYTPECGVNAADFATASTITAIDGTAITVSDVGGNDDDWFSRGILQVGTSFFFIRRQVGTDLILFGPLPRGLTLPAACTLYAGDDLTHETCRDKFSNLDRFLGFKWLPSKDPTLDLEHRGPDLLTAFRDEPDPPGYTTPSQYLWYRPDRPGLDPDGPSESMLVQDGNFNVEVWQDSTANHRDAAQLNGSFRPAGISGGPTSPDPFHETGEVDFGSGSLDESGSTWLVLPDLSGLTAAEIFINVQAGEDPPSVFRPLLSIHAEGFGGDGDTVFWPDRHMSSGLGIEFRSDGPFTFPIPTSLRRANNVFNWSIAPDRWTCRLNGVVLFTTTPGDNPFTVNFAQATPILGGRGDTQHWVGPVKRFLIYDAVLNNADRAAATEYMTTGIGTPP